MVAALATVTAAPACTRPNPAWVESVSESSQGGSQSGSSGSATETTGGSDGTDSTQPTSPTASGSGGTTAGTTTTESPPTSSSSGSSSTGEPPVEPPQCDGLEPRESMGIELSINAQTVVECGGHQEFSGAFWGSEIVNGAWLFEFRDSGCDDLGQGDAIHILQGAAPEMFVPNVTLEYLKCVMVEVWWQEPDDNNECEIESAVIWRITKDGDIPIWLLEKTPLWGVWNGPPYLEPDHPLVNVAPQPVHAGETCVCPEFVEECCIEPDAMKGWSEAGPYLLQSQWEPVTAGEDLAFAGHATYVHNNEPFCSDYDIYNHRSRIQPYCSGERDRFEWIANRTDNDDDFACEMP